MQSGTGIKNWIEAKAPSLAVLYQNKYVGMFYDRFASLPAKKQKQWVLTIFGITAGSILFYLVWSYWSLWSLTSSTHDIYAMNNMLLQHQKHQRDRGEDLQLLTRNSQLAAPGQLKQYLLQMTATSGISPRLVQVEERAEAAVGGAEPNKKDVKMKESSVSMQRVTLSQVINYLKSIEFGIYSLMISSIKMTNDDKLRGYLNVDLTVIAYLFDGENG